MIQDLFHLPDQGRGDVQVFYANTNPTVAWAVWKKPKGCTFVQMFALGGAGGGGTGFTRTLGNPGGGGGGGGSGASTRLLIPALFLPDILFISVGAGGASAASGLGTLISIAPSNTAGLLMLQASPGTFGGNGTGTVFGGAGTGGGSNPNAVGLALASIYANAAGGNGSNGGTQTGAVGATLTQASTPFLVTGGAGGAGCTSTTEFAGGPVNTISGTFYQNIAGGLAAASPGAAGGNGGDGFQFAGMFTFLGGSGGGSSNSGVAGSGGAGALGCGGGGGGAGATGGAGGRGGDGLVVMVSW